MRISLIPTSQKILWFSLGLVLFGILGVWLRSGFNSLTIDTDIGRDVAEISNIQAGKVVWLGPWLGPGFHASSSYYYFFYPAVELAGGRIIGMLIFNVVLGFFSVSLYGCLAVKKYGYRGLVSTILLGFFPIITQNILHPGNGYTYLFFVLMSMTALWFEMPLVMASLAAGMAIAFHPVAGFLTVFLFYEWWRRGRSWKSAILNAGAFLLPMAPLIAFEFITKGYVLRSFLARPGTGYFNFGLTGDNFLFMSELLGFPLWWMLMFIAISIFSAFKSQNQKLKSWTMLMLGCLTVSLFLNHLVSRYLFGLTIIVAFFLLVSLVQRKATAAILLIMSLMLFPKTPLFVPAPEVQRSAARLETVADFVSSEMGIDRSKKLAVVAALSPATEVPQADDYRFLLRNRDFQVVDTTAHAEAEMLVMVIEVADFDWENWSNWEISSFGPKRVKSVKKFLEYTIIVFEKG